MTRRVAGGAAGLAPRVVRLRLGQDDRPAGSNRIRVMFSCWMTEMRLPGSGTSFSAKGLRSCSLGMLSPQPATKAAHSKSTTGAANLPRVPDFPGAGVRVLSCLATICISLVGLVT